jgi:hypothetical protein
MLSELLGGMMGGELERDRQRKRLRVRETDDRRKKLMDY